MSPMLLQPSMVTQKHPPLHHSFHNVFDSHHPNIHDSDHPMLLQAKLKKKMSFRFFQLYMTAIMHCKHDERQATQCCSSHACFTTHRPQRHLRNLMCERPSPDGGSAKHAPSQHSPQRHSRAYDSNPHHSGHYHHVSLAAYRITLSQYICSLGHCFIVLGFQALMIDHASPASPGMGKPVRQGNGWEVGHI